MQFIRDIHAAKLDAKRPVISFEFFPPKTDEGDRNLLEKTIPALMKLKPDYCSVTYGAGGSTREKTLMIVDRIQREHQLTAMAHLTCVNATAEQIGEVLSPALSPDAFAGNAVPDAADERAVLCTPGDVDEFVEAVTGLVRHPELWPTLGRNARQALLENFTWERHVAKIWTHLLKQPGAGKEFA